ncbi:polysaccharide biosynthesis tyrosine autokinase [Robinsoniella peoriensis]|uniref:polysaccharide biosynthesis tyrosine autokinase n=1 Tax=Robinsoniella peoriensis TaxID=180332 RepID=UPI00363B8B69
MQLYNDKIDIIYDDDKILDVRNFIDNMWNGLKRWKILLLLVFLMTSGGIVAVKSWNYTLLYQAKLTYVVTKTGDAATDVVITGRLSASFPDILANTGLSSDIKQKMQIKEEKLPGSIRMYNTSSSNMLNVMITSADYNQANAMMEAFQETYPVYASKNVGTVELNVIDYTLATENPVNPYPQLKYILMGILSGGCCVFVLLVCYALTRKTIRRETDMKKIVNLDCLAYIPKVKEKKRTNKEVRHILISDKKVSYDFRQAIRSIQSRTAKHLKEENAKILMITSSLPSEGKTTFAVNLAQAMADEGKRVVLVDCDLRHPSIGTMLGIENSGEGLQDVIENKLELEKAVKKYRDHIMVLCAGKAREDTANVLSNPRFQEILDSLGSEYDYVVIDTPPVSFFTDASMISEYADAGIYLVRQDYVEARYVREGMEMLANSELKLVGYVLNYVEAGFLKYGYHNYYYGKSYRYYKQKVSDGDN